MAWCPKCKEEYREGIKVCADCGTELVDSLPEEGQEQEETTVSHEDTEDSRENVSIETDSTETDSDEEYDWDAEDEVQEEDVPEQEETEPEPSEEESGTGFVSNAMYAKKSDEYKDLKFSGFTFIFFGLLGILYLVLCKLEVIGLTYSLPIFIVLVLMFVVFIGVGVHSLIKSSKVKALIGDEEELTRKVEDAMASIMTQELIDSVFVEDATEEENFLTLSEEVKGRIAEEFGTDGLTETYIDQLIDEYYSEHYEK